MSEGWSSFHADVRKQLRDEVSDLADQVARLEHEVAVRDSVIADLEDRVARLAGDIADAQSRHPSRPR